MQTTLSSTSLRLIPEKSPGKNSVFHGTLGCSATAITYPSGVSWNVMRVLMRLVLVGLLPVLLVSCRPAGSSVPKTPQAGPYSFEEFSLSEEGISIDYPDGWFVEDAHTGGSVGFFPWEPTPEDNLGPSASIHIGTQVSIQTLGDFALSTREDIQDMGGPCTDPTPAQVAGRDGLMMECDPAWTIYFVQNDSTNFAIFLDKEKLPEIVWTHMQDSIRVR